MLSGGMRRVGVGSEWWCWAGEDRLREGAGAVYIVSSSRERFREFGSTCRNKLCRSSCVCVGPGIRRQSYEAVTLERYADASPPSREINLEVSSPTLTA